MRAQYGRVLLGFNGNGCTEKMNSFDKLGKVQKKNISYFASSVYKLDWS